MTSFSVGSARAYSILTVLHRHPVKLVAEGSLHIIRVLPGQYGLGLQNGHPVVLLPGRHLINDPLFSFAGARPMTDPHVSISTTHLITVAKGKVGLCTVNTTAHFLEPGSCGTNLTFGRIYPYVALSCSYSHVHPLLTAQACTE